VGDKYELDLGSYDRSGRLWSESFQFEPADAVVDPLADYFGEMRGGMGGIRPMPAKLAQQPTRVEVVSMNGPLHGARKPGSSPTRVSPAPGRASCPTSDLEIAADGPGPTRSWRASSACSSRAATRKEDRRESRCAS
jgi:hypothetical protein